MDYDYGFRIYDARVGKFLSVDPLTKNYPHLTPYQFAGNSPISDVDIDGKELQSYTFDYQYKSLFNLNTSQELDRGETWSKVVNDPKLGFIDVEIVYDDVTKQNWIIHEDDGHWYYLKNDNGKNDVLTLKGCTIDVKGGHFEEYKTYDEIAYEQTDGLIRVISGGTAWIIVAPFAAEAIVSAPPLVQSLIGGKAAIGAVNEIEDETSSVAEGQEGANAQENTKTGTDEEPATEADNGLQGGKKLSNDRLNAAPDKRGNAPVGDDGHPVELHHTD